MIGAALEASLLVRFLVDFIPDMEVRIQDKRVKGDRVFAYSDVADCLQHCGLYCVSHVAKHIRP